MKQDHKYFTFVLGKCKVCIQLQIGKFYIIVFLLYMCCVNSKFILINAYLLGDV